MTPEAALDPATPAKKIAKATGIVTSVASQAMPLTSVPMISAALPTTARPRCAMALSRLVPPNDARTSVAKLPNTANSVICGLPMTSKVSANRHGSTIVARAARMKAGTDHTGSQPGRACPDCAAGRQARDNPARSHPGPAAALVESVIVRSVRSKPPAGQAR